MSGNLIHDRKILNEIKIESQKNIIHLIYGFGAIFSEALNNQNIPFKYANGIRETTEDGLRIGIEISKKIRDELKKHLGNDVHLISPINIVGNKIINTNADEILLEAHKNYDNVVIYTLKGRDKSHLSEMHNLEIREI